MAVYTKITKDLLISFMKNYDLGEIKDFQGIEEGVENTNYKIISSKKIYILTIFEKRVNEDDLPFFINLLNHLSIKKIKCPKPIADNKGDYINRILNKPCVIMSFLSGQKIQLTKANHCFQVGNNLAKIHKATLDFNLNRKNNLNQQNWKALFEKCKKIKDNKYIEIFEEIEKSLIYLDKNWPNKLPKGIIHADVFRDNVFFINDKLTGVIDFYFACNDFYAYELAICINAWCFDQKINFSIKKFTSIIEGYQSLRKTTSQEIEFLPILLQGAAMRFLLTRLHDQLYHPAEAFVNPKDPLEYFEILKFHQNFKLPQINVN